MAVLESKQWAFQLCSEFQCIIKTVLPRTIMVIIIRRGQEGAGSLNTFITRMNELGQIPNK